MQLSQSLSTQYMFVAENCGHGRQTTGVQAMEYIFVIVISSDVTQMSDMSGAHQNTTWRSLSLPALLPCQPADRPDGEADKGGRAQLLPP